MVAPDPSSDPGVAARDQKKPYERDAPDSLPSLDLHFILGLFFVAFHFFTSWSTLAIPLDAIAVFKERDDATKTTLARVSCAFQIIQLVFSFVNQVYLLCSLTPVLAKKDVIDKTWKLSLLSFASAWIVVGVVIANWSGVSRPAFVNWQIASATLAGIFSTLAFYAFTRVSYWENPIFREENTIPDPIDPFQDPKPLRDEMIVALVFTSLNAALSWANWNLVAALGEMSGEQLDNATVRSTIVFTIIWIVFATVAYVFTVIAVLPEAKAHPERNYSHFLAWVFSAISLIASFVAFLTQLGLRGLGESIPQSVRRFTQYEAYSLFGWLLGAVFLSLLLHVWIQTGGSPSVGCAPVCNTRLPPDELEHVQETRRIERLNEIARLDVERLALEARRRELERASEAAVVV